MINKVNVTLLRQFLGLYCPSNVTIRLTQNVFLISLLFRIFSSLKQFHLPLFMINKVNVTLLRQFLGLYCPSKLIIRLTDDVFLISLFVRIVSNLNHIDLPLFMNYKVNVTLLRQCVGLYCLSKLIIRLTYDVFLISLLFSIVSSQNQFHLPLFMINKVNVTLLRQFLGLYCPSNVTIRLTQNVFLISLLFRIFSSLNQFHLPLFMINKVNVTLLRQFLCMYCPSKLIIRLTDDVFLISLLVRIVSNLNHIDLPLFMNYNVNVTLLRQFLGLYCLSKLIIRLTYDVFLISLLFRIVSSLNKFHLPLFMINKVNVTLLRQFLGLYCPSKLIIRLTDDVFLISLFVRIVSNLNHIDLPLFMNYKVNVTLLRQCVGLYCLSKLIIRLTYDVFLISLLFMIFSSLNQFHLPLLMINKVNVTLFRQFLGLYCLSKLIIRLTHDVCIISLLFMIFSSLNQFHLLLFMIKKVNVTLLRQFLALNCPSKIIIRLTYDVFLISLLFMIFSSLYQFHLPLFMIKKVNVTLFRQFLGLYCPSKLIIRLTDVVFLISLLVRIVSNLNNIDLPLFMNYKVKCYIIKTVSRLVLSFQDYYKVNSRCFLNIIIIYDLFSPESISFTSVHDQ